MKTEPTKAKQMIEDSWLFASTTNSFKKDSFKAINIAFQEGQSSPKIKPLNWEFHGIYYSAQTAFGAYILEENEENENMCDLYSGNLLLYSNIPVNEAKCIAQEDYEKRIKECLIIE